MIDKNQFEAQVIAKYDRQNGKMIKIGRGNSDIFIEESWGHSMEWKKCDAVIACYLFCHNIEQRTL